MNTSLHFRRDPDVRFPPLDGFKLLQILWNSHRLRSRMSDMWRNKLNRIEKLCCGLQLAYDVLSQATKEVLHMTYSGCSNASPQAKTKMCMPRTLDNSYSLAFQTLNLLDNWLRTWRQQNHENYIIMAKKQTWKGTWIPKNPTCASIDHNYSPPTSLMFCIMDVVPHYFSLQLYIWFILSWKNLIIVRALAFLLHDRSQTK